MKKIKYLLCLFIIMFGFINVNADDAVPILKPELKYYISSSELNFDNSKNTINVKRGDYVYVTAIINSSDEIEVEKGQMTVRWDDKVFELVKNDTGEYYTLKDFNNLSANITNTSNRLKINYELNHTLSVSKNKVLEFKFKVLENAKTGVSKIYEMEGEDSLTCHYKSEDGIYKCAENLSSEINYNIKSSDTNTLTSIKVDAKELDGFNEKNNNYNLKVASDKETINIEVVKKDDKSNVSGDVGTKKLEYGTNTFNIVVTSESNIKNTYTLTIERTDSRSKINTLKTLKLSSGIINFKSDVNNYDINVKNEVDEITIISTLTDPKSKYDVDYSKKTVELQEGINKIEIKVIAENNQENIYTLNITRELSSNNTLKELMVNDYSIGLFKNAFSYTYEVSNEISEVVIKAIPTDSAATVKVEGNTKLSVGENEFNIYVTAPNGDKVSYTLYITRDDLLSSDSTLSDLKVAGYKLNFSKDTKYYYLKIGDEETLDITYTADPKAKVSVEGNRDLINGSIIKITVRSEDNNVTRYFINIEKSEGPNIALIIIITILILTLIFIVTMIILKKKKNKIDKNFLEDKKEEVKEENQVTINEVKEEQEVNDTNNTEESNESSLNEENIEAQSNVSEEDTSLKENNNDE